MMYCLLATMYKHRITHLQEVQQTRTGLWATLEGMDVSWTWDDEKLVAKFRRDELQNFLRHKSTLPLPLQQNRDSKYSSASASPRNAS
jgi:hypothetical protein